MFTSQNRYLNQSYFMKLALDQAKKNLGNTKTNPSVGCVIIKKNSVISAGCTSINGRPHAEDNAINFSKTNLKDSELYVTLEPCVHYGLTAPCVDKIIKKKIKKVYFSIIDPDVRTCDKSTILFKKKKIIVKKGILSKHINDFYRSYYKSKTHTLPFVTCKLAISKDFFTIHKKNEWITNRYSRYRGHLIRSYNDCLITTFKTISSDNSKLTCRIPGLTKRSPCRIILDTHLKISLNSYVVKDAKRYRTIIFFNKDSNKNYKKLKKLKVKLYKLPIDQNKKLNLFKVLNKAKQLGFLRILLEAGSEMTKSFLEKDLVDDFNLFISNKKLKRNGAGNIKNTFKTYLKNKESYEEKVNLFGEKLLIFKIK